nr:hypothetical protein [Mycolicibacterium malmesburyense]CRL67352.1 Fatty acyl-AMP ligase FadD28 and polyketide synthase [Mycolicibacterium malmesburyense]
MPASRRRLGRARRCESNVDAPPDNSLAFIDQGWFAGRRATGQEEVVQCVWLYEHAIDFDRLRRFRDNLRSGLLGRRIERSPLPFARDRWVLDQTPHDIEIDERRTRAELIEWADERSQIPTNSELGPGWHLSIVPLTDGSTAVSLVASHYLVDGLGMAGTIADAVAGNRRNLNYPPPRSRTRREAIVQDLRQRARDAPEVRRAVAATVRTARLRRNNLVTSPESRPAPVDSGSLDEVLVVPSVTIYVDLNDWDARAELLGGTTRTLVAGFATKLAERLGRRRATDGAVTLQLPISERAADDTRAIAVSFARVSTDPTRVTTDLRDLRAAIKDALAMLRETPDESLQFFWLTPFMPKRALKRLSEAAFADPDLPVFCSDLGHFGPELCRIDGTDAEPVTARVTRQGVTRGWLERTGGHLTLQSFRIVGKIGISVVGYQPGKENTKPALQELAELTLSDFELSGRVV